MASNKKTVPFYGTEEKKEQLLKVIQELRDEKGCLMPIMQKAQEIYGYLPIQVQTMISDQTGHPLEEIYGIATFYSMFNLNPKGKYRIDVCLGTACYVKGSERVLQEIERVLGVKADTVPTADGLFSISALRCVGACGLAPVMVINGKVYGKVTPAKAVAIINEYKAKG